MSRPRPVALLSRAWLLLVAVTALTVGSFSVWKVHQLSAPAAVPTVNPPQAPPEFTPKTLSYVVDGDLASGGLLSYVDIDGHPHTVEPATLPWTHDETTMLAVVSGSISAQVRGGYATCRILVDGVVRDTQSSTRPDADVTCRVKSA